MYEHGTKKTNITFVKNVAEFRFRYFVPKHRLPSSAAVFFSESTNSVLIRALPFFVAEESPNNGADTFARPKH